MVRIKFSDMLRRPHLLTLRAALPAHSALGIACSLPLCHIARKLPPRPRLDDLKPGRKRFRRVNPQCVESRRERGSLNHGDNSRSTAKIYCLLDTTDEPATDNALMDELVAHFQLSLGCQMRQAR